MQSMRALHRHLHFKRSGARGSKTIRNGGRSGLHEMHGLHQRLSERRACILVLGNRRSWFRNRTQLREITL